MLAVVSSQSTSWNVIERICYPAPQPGYTIKSFPDELILVPRDDGAKVPCLFLPFKHARFILLYFHGNAEDLGLCYSFCSSVRDQFQVHVLAVEYPGYGICPGPCDEAGVLANATAAMNFVTDDLKWPLDGIKILGRSLGTGPAVSLATRFDVAGVILVTPFTSLREVFRCQIGALADYLMDRFDSMSLIDMVRSPTLIIHGQRDSLIPCSQGEALYQKLSCKKMMVCPAEMDHNTSLLNSIETFVLPMIQFFSLPDYAFEDIEMPAWVFPDTSKAEAELLQKDDSLLARIRRAPTPQRATSTDVFGSGGGKIDRSAAPTAWRPVEQNGPISATRPVTPRPQSVPILDVPTDEPVPPPAWDRSPTKPRADATVEFPADKLDVSPKGTSATRNYSFATPPVTPRTLAPRRNANIEVVNSQGKDESRASKAPEKPLQSQRDQATEATATTNDEKIWCHDAVLLRAVDESISLFIDSGMASSRQNSLSEKPQGRTICDVDDQSLKRGVEL